MEDVNKTPKVVLPELIRLNELIGQLKVAISLPSSAGSTGDPYGRPALANRQLEAEWTRLEEGIAERMADLEAMVEVRTKELELKSRELQDLNTALKILLKQRDEDKKELEETVMANIRNLILPYLEKLKGSHLGKHQLALLSLIESQMDGITTSFSRKSITEGFSAYTPAEQRVIGLVKEGKSTKEMAEILGVSQKTISCHRDNIRAKLGLRGKRSRLRSHLLSLD